jgi:hypothetical protein
LGNTDTTSTGGGYGDSGYGDDGSGQSAGTKKEGLMTKLKDKLPGHHGSSDDTSTDQTDSVGAPPKKGLISKIKDKLPGNHGSNDF